MYDLWKESNIICSPLNFTRVEKIKKEDTTLRSQSCTVLMNLNVPLQVTVK